MAILSIRKIKRMSRREDGSVAMIIGLTLFLLIMAVGVAVDMTRAQILQQRMSSSLDAAGLAAAETITTPPSSFCVGPETLACATAWANSEAARFFNANFPPGYLGSAIPAPTVTVSADFNTLDLTVTGTQAPVFMQIFGVGSLNITANSQVTRNSNGLGMELAMVLDNTGSMASPLPSQPTTKMQAAQSAANELVTILLGGATPPTNVWVGLVPFTQSVNIGAGTSTTLVGSAFDSAYNATLPFDPGNLSGQWGGCVTSRSPTAVDASNGLTYDLSDLPPTGAGSTFQYYFFNAAQVDPPGGPPGYTPPMSNAACNADAAQPCYYNQWQTSATTYDYSPLGPGLNMGPNLFCAPAIVTPLTANTTTLANGIGAMTPSGDTQIDVGLAWGWRMVSPNWLGLWNDSEMTTNNLPLPYNTPGDLKVIVLMTDGTNYTGEGQYSSYGMFNSGSLGNGYTSIIGETAGCDANDCEQAASLDLDQRTRNVCDAMKAQNIVIYTIGFGSPAPNNPPQWGDRINDTVVDVPLLQYCAGGTSNGVTGQYFLAPTNVALQNAFQTIGNALENIRVSK